MRRLLAIALFFIPTVASAGTLREQYDSCVTQSYLSLLVDGRPANRITAESAVTACETELQAIYGLLVNTNMPPKQAVWMITTIRSTAKAGLLSR